MTYRIITPCGTITCTNANDARQYKRLYGFAVSCYRTPAAEGSLNINALINWKGRFGAYYDIYGAAVVRLIHDKFHN